MRALKKHFVRCDHGKRQRCQREAVSTIGGSNLCRKHGLRVLGERARSNESARRLRLTLEAALAGSQP